MFSKLFDSQKKSENSAKKNTKSKHSDEKLEKYKNFNNELSKIIERIAVKLKPHSLTKNDLKELKNVSDIPYNFDKISQYFNDLKNLLYDKEKLILNIIEKELDDKGIEFLLLFWNNKIKENISKFKENKQILDLKKEIDNKIEYIKSLIDSKSKEKKKSNTILKNIPPNKKESLKNKVSLEEERSKSHNFFKDRGNNGKIKIEYNTIETISDDTTNSNKLSRSSTLQYKFHKINTLEKNTFTFQKEIYGYNILTTTKTKKPMITYIDFDLLLQKVAMGKDIYDIYIDNENLLKGICLQHPIFMDTNSFVLKIISCFNFFYSGYLNDFNIGENEETTNELSMGNTINSQNNNPNVLTRAKTLEVDAKRIPFELIDLMIMLVDVNHEFPGGIIDDEVSNNIMNFFDNILNISEIKEKYEEDIEITIKKLKGDKSKISSKNENKKNKITISKIFGIKETLADKMVEPESRKSFFDIFKYSAKDIAMELTRVSYLLFSKIEPKEFFKGAFTKKNKEETSPNICKITKRFNQLSFWVIEEVLSYDYAKTRAKVIEKFIDIANELKELNNFYDCMSITSGLGQMILTHLTKTWKNVSSSKNKVLNKIKNFLNFQDNYKFIREKIAVCLEEKDPFIPFLGPYNKRICFLEESGPYLKANTSLINIDKILQVYQVLSSIFNMMKFEYDFKIDPNIIMELVILQCIQTYDEDKLDELSSFIEPNFLLADKKSKLKRITCSEINFKENYEKLEEIL